MRVEGLDFKKGWQRVGGRAVQRSENDLIGFDVPASRVEETVTTRVEGGTTTVDSASTKHDERSDGRAALGRSGHT